MGQPTSMSRESRQHRGRVAALARDRSPSDPELLDARRDLRAERLADHIRRAVDQAPPLTDEQLHRLSQLLGPRRGAR